MRGVGVFSYRRKHMQLYKRKGVYQVSYQSSGGHQIRRSLKTRDKAIAKQKIAKLELELHEAKLF